MLSQLNKVSKLKDCDNLFYFEMYIVYDIIGEKK